MPGNVVLIGFSGTGKSTVAARLAERSGWPLVDVDAEIVAHFGASIAAVFTSRGEAAFRTVESELTARALDGQRTIISLGGGATMDPRVRQLVRDGNRVVRLDASPETILARLRSSPGAEERPMLQGADPLERIRSLLAARAAAYAIADLVIDTEGRTPEEVAEQIVTWLGVKRT